MLKLPPIQKLGFSDPWKIKINFFFERQRYDPNAMTEDERTKMAGVANRARNKGGLSYFEEVDQTVDQEGQREKTELLNLLEGFEKKTGLSQEKARKKAEACTGKWELDELKEKLKQSGLKYLDDPKGKTGLIQKSMAYVPVHPAEEKILAAKEESFREFLGRLPAFAGNGEDSIASVIENFDKFVGPRLKFRSELKLQSKFVQTLFFLKLRGNPNPYAHEPDILKEVLATMKGLEQKPQALQKEYRKEIADGKDPDKALAEVETEFKIREELYSKELDPKCFGGKVIQTPEGPMRAARWEYKLWYKNSSKDFAQMDLRFEQLKTSEMPKRRTAYKKRDDLLEHFPENDSIRLREKTDEMRFHNLQAYLKDLENLSSKKSIHTLEYMAELESAEEEGMGLFTSTEKIRMKEEILADSPERQILELDRLRAKEIPNRVSVVKEFMALPEHIRLGQKDSFTRMSMEEKKSFLRKANENKNKSSTNPFNKLDDTTVDNKVREKGVINRLRSREGKSFLKDTLNKEQSAQSAKVIAEVTGRVGSWIEQLEADNLTQLEGRMKEDAHYGLHGYNDQVWKVGFDNSLAKNEKDQYYGNTFVMDMKLRNAGFDRRSGGKVEDELHIIDHTSWMNGDQSVLDELNDTAYDNMALFTGADGKDELNLRQEGRKAWLKNKEQLINTLIKLLGLEGSSKQVIDELTYSTMELDDAFGNADEFYGVASANNSSRFDESESEAA